MTLQKKQNNKLVSPRDLSETRFSFNHPTNQDSAGIQTSSPVSVTSEWEFTSPSSTSECDSSSSEGRSLHPAGSHSRPRDLLWRRGRARQEHSGDGERERVWIKASRWDSHSFSLWSETERWRDGGRVSFLSLHLTLERLSLSVSQSASFYHHLSLLSVISPSSSLTPCISLFSLLSTFSFTRLLLFTVTVQPEPLRLKLLSADSIYHPSLFQLSTLLLFLFVQVCPHTFGHNTNLSLTSSHPLSALSVDTWMQTKTHTCIRLSLQRTDTFSASFNEVVLS